MATSLLGQTAIFLGAAVIAAPLAEEMLYRVLLQQGFIVAGNPPRLVILGVAIFFCLNHANPTDPSSFLQTLPLLPLALLLGWVEHLRETVALETAVLVDELASELDGQARGRLLRLLSSLGCQVFVSAVDASLFAKSHLKQAAVFHVEQGSVRKMV